MRVSVFGLGYVGTVCSGCLALVGHDVLGVDSVQAKVAMLTAGQVSIKEPEIGEIVAETVRAGKLRATNDPAAAIRETDLSLVCVGTPGQANGDLDLSSLSSVCLQIGRNIKHKSERHTVVIRSTILPGTMRRVVIPALENSSGKKAGDAFGVCANPEFLREGSAVTDYHLPARTVIGELDRASGDALAPLYATVDAELIRTDLEIAEMVKFIDNSWHALKIGFANEIGNFCKTLSVDTCRALDIFLVDKKLNISTAYLSPGFAFGGSCLPKDLRALAHAAKSHSLDLPILSSILPSNDLQIERGLQLITQQGRKRIGILGLSFKPGTDDLRGSPLIQVIQRLSDRGFDVRVYDKHVKLETLIGANKEFLRNRIPRIAELMADSVENVLEYAEIVVIGHKDAEYENVSKRLRPGQSLVDFVGISDRERVNGEYSGICW